MSHTHAGVPAEDCPFYMKDLPCGCQDVYWACGLVDFEHSHVTCDTTTPWEEKMEKLIRGEQHICYCGSVYPSQELANLCHSFHQMIPGRGWE